MTVWFNSWFFASKFRFWFYVCTTFQGAVSELLQYHSKVSWHSKLETQDSILASQSSNALIFEMRGSRIESRVSMIEDRGSKKQGFPKERCCTLASLLRYSHRWSVRAVQCSVTVWIARVQQAFNECKSIFSVSKIYPACTVYVAFARHVLRFSLMNGAAWQSVN